MPGFPAESLKGLTAEQVAAAQARYAEAVQVVVDSLEAPVGLTPKEVVWTLNKARLYHYKPTRPPEERHPIPLLLVYALINKPFIFDLVPGRSFIEYMVDQGFDMYLLDWGAPGPEDQGITFDDYVTEYLTRAVRKVVRTSGVDEISMLGYCLGATLTTVYAGLYPEAPIRNLILLTAPIDFSSSPEGSMAMWLEEERLDVDRIVGAFGNVPGELIRLWAKLLKPVENFVGAYVNVWKNLDNEQAVQGWQAINRWVEDVIPFAGSAFRQFVLDYVRGNELIKGEHEIGGQRVDLSNIRAPLLNIVAQYDHIVAQSQSESIMKLVSSEDKELRVIPSTHVGIMASGRARYKLWPEVVEWLAPRSG
ncbi:MAG: class III poly(R)-hydroxyalkanoic acid synthase subunit PhaC [Anaerolineae bacterium]|jgi:polyhydroxyalkanoate synthase